MYSYGYLVPFVSLFLVWSRREALARHRPSPSLAGGIALLALWFALLVAGRFAAVILAEQIALVVAVAAGVVLVWGWATLRIVWARGRLPAADGAAVGRLHRAAAPAASRTSRRRIGVGVLELFGIPAHRDGVFITLPTPHAGSGARLQRRQLPRRRPRARAAARLPVSALAVAPRRAHRVGARHRRAVEQPARRA